MSGSAAVRINLDDYNIRVTDSQPTVIKTDDSGLNFGDGYPGYLGMTISESEWPMFADTPDDHIQAGVPGLENDSSGLNPSEMLVQNALGLFPNPEYTGEPGRTDRLAYDSDGPAHSGTVESFTMNGARIRPGRPDLARGGPVGASGDLGNYNAVAMAQSTYDFPPEDIAQLNIALGI